MRVLHIAGPSDSGKTHLIEHLLATLPVVQVIKWTHHPLMQDKPGSDTSRFHARGIDSTMLVAPDGVVWRQPVIHRPCVYQLVANFWSDTDLVLVEGDKHSPYPKIWVGRDLPPKTVNVCLVIGPYQPAPDVAWIASEIPLLPQALAPIMNTLSAEWTRFTYIVARSTHD